MKKPKQHVRNRARQKTHGDRKDPARIAAFEASIAAGLKRRDTRQARTRFLERELPKHLDSPRERLHIENLLAAERNKESGWPFRHRLDLFSVPGIEAAMAAIEKPDFSYSSIAPVIIDEQFDFRAGSGRTPSGGSALRDARKAAEIAFRLASRVRHLNP